MQEQFSATPSMEIKMAKKYFGTDGIRGKVGAGLMSPEKVLKLGWAVGRVLASQKNGSNKKVVIGKDTRISGYMFESGFIGRRGGYRIARSDANAGHCLPDQNTACLSGYRYQCFA